ncbi:hypothetical protein COB52_05655 [Candidatus Kaiserbacteria bacterium]|nr:MAG: hypothetical protein COB52_05655 [Candidatus Kaiserbacteria bacterium]
MKFTLAYYILVLLLLANEAFAGGNEVGNGGDAIVCSQKVELFDFFEAKMLKRQIIQLPKGKDPFEVAKKTIQRLKKLNPQLERQYLQVLKSFKTRIKFIDKVGFRDVKDSFEVAIPEGCKLEQAAIQQLDSGKRLVRISKKIWDKLSPAHRAGLILHEIIYEHFIFLGEKNSIKARKFNSLLSSKEILSFGKKEYLKYVRKLRVPIY